MSLVSNVGRRSWKVRLLFLAMYLILTVGAVTMVYPFMLMLGTATTGAADSWELKMVPTYWFSDSALFKKYMIDCTGTNVMSVWWGIDTWFSARDMKNEDLQKILDKPADKRKARAADVREYIAKVCPDELKMPVFQNDADSHLAFHTKYRNWLKERYGSLSKINKVYMDNASKWEDITVPWEQGQRRPEDTPRIRDYREYVETRKPEETGLFIADSDVYAYLQTIEVPKVYKQRFGKKFNPATVTYDDIVAGKLGSDIKKEFISSKSAGRFIRIDTAKAKSAWQNFTKEINIPSDTPLTDRMPITQQAAGHWALFVQRSCPIEAMHLIRPEDTWRPFVERKYGDIRKLNEAYGTSFSSFGQVRLPLDAMYTEDFLNRKSQLRKDYLSHNFTTVMSFITIHGDALIVTVVYILLTILTTLTVNPLAAYAMSRFRLKESYHVLVFLLATMAFPGEVLMIPSFLMIKSFPLLQICAVGVFILLYALLHNRLKKRMSFALSATVAFVAMAAIAGWVVPYAAQALHLKVSVSLMNSFWALILPGLANGYGIFLLKGFFDSLPPELYEAGLIDGAGEMTMFWKITLPLCKPILAVLALGAFTAAYGAFMHAFLVCQDPKMWTLMVFLYEFQQVHGVPMAMASLVIAAIPTLVVFIFCQNIILRGIVIPTYK